MPKHRFEKGHEKYENQGKRGKGKFTNLKNAFIEAFKEIGGEKELANFAESNRNNQRAFYQMISKMLPHNVTFGEDESNEIVFKMEQVLKNMNDRK